MRARADIIAVGRGVPTTWVYLDGQAANPFTKWLVWASNTSDIPFVNMEAPELELIQLIPCHPLSIGDRQ